MQPVFMLEQLRPYVEERRARRRIESFVWRAAVAVLFLFLYAGYFLAAKQTVTSIVEIAAIKSAEKDQLPDVEQAAP